MGERRLDRGAADFRPSGQRFDGARRDLLRVCCIANLRWMVMVMIDLLIDVFKMTLAALFVGAVNYGLVVILNVPSAESGALGTFIGLLVIAWVLFPATCWRNYK